MHRGYRGCRGEAMGWSKDKELGKPPFRMERGESCQLCSGGKGQGNRNKTCVMAQEKEQVEKLNLLEKGLGRVEEKGWRQRDGRTNAHQPRQKKIYFRRCPGVLQQRRYRGRRASRKIERKKESTGDARRREQRRTG